MFFYRGTFIRSLSKPSEICSLIRATGFWFGNMLRTGFAVFWNVFAYCRIIAGYSRTAFLKNWLSGRSFLKLDGQFDLWPVFGPSTITWLTVFGALSVICGTRIEKPVLLFVLELLLLFCLLNVSSTESLGGWSTADREEITSVSGFMTSLIGVLFTSIFEFFSKFSEFSNENWP